MSLTTVVAKQAVIDVAAAALAAAGELDVQVHWGTATAWAEAGTVWVGDVVTTRSRPRMGPERRADEVHEVTLYVGCSTQDGTPAGQQSCAERAVRLLDVIDAALRAQPTESLTAAARAAGVQLGEITGQVSLTETDPEEATVRKGRRALLEATVTVTARRV